MSSLFTGKSGLRHQYSDLVYTDLSTATNAATAKLLALFAGASRMAFIDNATDKDLALYLVHPDADATDPAKRLFWLEIPANRVLNYDVSYSTGLVFDPGCKLYVSQIAGGGAPTSGKIRLAAWG